jgi:hypothetical protein
MQIRNNVQIMLVVIWGVSQLSTLAIWVLFVLGIGVSMQLRPPSFILDGLRNSFLTLKCDEADLDTNLLSVW